MTAVAINNRHSQPMKPALADYTAGPQRRLTITLALALAIHAAVILGIRFNPLPQPDDEPASSLNVTLLRAAGSESAVRSGQPDQAPLEPSPPAEPLPLEAGEPLQAVTPPPQPKESLPLETAEAVQPLETAEAVQPVTAPSSQASVPEPSTTARAVTHQEPAAPPKPPAPEPAAPTPSATDIMHSGLQMARLSAQSDPSTSQLREKYFNPKAKSTIEDYYVMNWVRKVERVGTLNFPDEARRRDLSGSLILDVALRADGSIQKITLLRSSGHKILDAAARDIVELAAPYAPFPEEMRRQYDILHIKRTWQFLQGHGLQGN